LFDLSATTFFEMCCSDDHWALVVVRIKREIWNASIHRNVNLTREIVIRKAVGWGGAGGEECIFY
jgi:hypothetical protein